MKKWALLFGLIGGYGVVQAADYSGTYACNGLDAHEGKYTGKVTLAHNASQSKEGYDAYDFTLDVPGFGVYPGEAVALGNQMAIHFALKQAGSQDYGTGMATFKKTAAGKWTFHKYYYEPAYKGGNYGTEDCVQH